MWLIEVPAFADGSCRAGNRVGHDVLANRGLEGCAPEGGPRLADQRRARYVGRHHTVCDAE